MLGKMKTAGFPGGGPWWRARGSLVETLVKVSFYLSVGFSRIGSVSRLFSRGLGTRAFRGLRAHPALALRRTDQRHTHTDARDYKGAAVPCGQRGIGRFCWFLWRRGSAGLEVLLVPLIW